MRAVLCRTGLDGDWTGLGWGVEWNASHCLVHVAVMYVCLYVRMCVSYCIDCRSGGSWFISLLFPRGGDQVLSSIARKVKYGLMFRRTRLVPGPI